MDDTLENLTEVWVDEINKRNFTDYSAEKNLTQWDITKCLNLPSDKIYEVLYDLSTYEKIKPLPEAQEYVEKLNNDGRFEIFVATNTYYKVYSHKMEYALFRYFPFLKSNQLICISNKQMLKCDLLIDDYDKNLVGGEYDKILIDRPYNKHCITDDIKNLDINSNIIKRAIKWSDIYNYIMYKYKDIKKY